MSGLKPHDVPDEVESSEWTLRVIGAVTRPRSIRLAALESLRGETRADGFECAQRWTAEALSWRGALPMGRSGPVQLVPTDADLDSSKSIKWVSKLEIEDSEPVVGDTAEEIATARFGWTCG